MTEVLTNFSWQKPEIVPAFVQGADAEEVYKLLTGMPLGWMDYQEGTKLLRGSTPFIAARIDTHLGAYGIWAANLTDLSRPEVMRMVKGRYYVDAPVFILRTLEDDTNPKNLPLIKEIAEEVEKTNGRLELPLMISGFDIIPAENDKGYGLTILPRADFRAVHDERLEGNFHSRKFYEVDELGLPKFDRKGNRNWLNRPEGISRISLNFDLDLVSSIHDLTYSDEDGLVVILKKGEEVK